MTLQTYVKYFIATKQFVLNILNFCFVAIKYYINKIRLLRKIV
nr:MAG TPA: hypothetical protein [Caudoviricetes sp.]